MYFEEPIWKDQIFGSCLPCRHGMRTTLMLRQGRLDRKAMLNVEQNKKESFIRQKVAQRWREREVLSQLFPRTATSCCHCGRPRGRRRGASTKGSRASCVSSLFAEWYRWRGKAQQLPSLGELVITCCWMIRSLMHDWYWYHCAAEASGCLAADTPKVNGALFMETIIGDRRSPFPFSFLYQNMLLLLSFAKQCPYERRWSIFVWLLDIFDIH